MTRCLACEIHLICRVVLRFTREAVVSGQHADTLAKICSKFKHNYIYYEKPELSKTGMKGAIYTIIIDEQMANMQKRTANKVAMRIKALVKPENLEEGFIEVHRFDDIIELLDTRGGYTCKR